MLHGQLEATGLKFLWSFCQDAYFFVTREEHACTLCLAVHQKDCGAWVSLL